MKKKINSWRNWSELFRSTWKWRLIKLLTFPIWFPVVTTLFVLAALLALSIYPFIWVGYWLKTGESFDA